jgi:membrane-associated phospholipid phosphatase
MTFHPVGSGTSENKPSTATAGISSNPHHGPAPVSRAAWRRLVLTAVVVLAQPSPASAQLDSLAPVQAPPAIRWWHGAIVLGGLSALLLLDQPTERFLQNHRSGSLNDIARTVRHLGQPEVYGTVTVGLVAGGLLSSNDNLTRAGGRLAATLLLAGATSTAGKLAFGRPRPNENPDADVFVPFSGQDAMPSGHSTIAFALAVRPGPRSGSTRLPPG